MFSTQRLSGFDPRTIPGCQLWLDGADLNTFSFSSGSNISQWRDKSGNIKDATSLLSPPLLSNKTVVFSGDAIFGTSLSFSGLFTMTYFIVGYVSSTVWMSLIGVNTATTHGGYQVRLYNYQQKTSTYGGTTINDLGGFVTPNSTFLYNGLLDSGSTSITYLNGDQTSIGTAPTMNNSGTFCIGGYKTPWQSGAELYTGGINEIIIYDINLTTSQRQQVEGYLAWKWGLNASLASGHSFRPTPPMMRAFVPTDIGGCQLWLDGADLNTFSFSSGSNVSQWNDKSGGGYHMTVPSTFINPTYQSSAVFFSGSGTGNAKTQMLTNSSIPLNSSASGYSIYVVAKGNTSQPSYTGYNYVLSTTRSDGAGLFFGAHLGMYATFNGYPAFNDINSNTPAISVTSQARILGMVVSGSSLTPYADGSILTTKVGTVGVLTGLNIGDATTAANFTGQNWNGYVNEIIIYDSALTTTQRQSVEGYLASKWGLPIAYMVSDHPYKNFRP